MTVLIQIPGVLSSIAGLERLMPTNNGFPSEGLTDLLLLADGAGVAPSNSVAGRLAGVIEAPQTFNNAYAWLAGGGGLRLDGTQILTMPASDASAAWSLVSVGSMIGSVGGTASERIAGILGFKEFTTQTRGAALLMRGGNDWNIVGAAPFYQHRDTNGGASGTVESLLPSSGLSELDAKRVRVFSYNGTDTLTSTIYDKNGNTIASDTVATTDARMFTIGGATVTNLTPCVGLSSATYQSGSQEVEAFARYGRALTSADIARICAAGAALGAARGRPW
jgi:hypothetical protein